MFTGIVEATGEVTAFRTTGSGRSLHVRAGVLADAPIGGSVAVDGACLTVTERDGDLCAFDVSAETLARTTLGSCVPSQAVNIERPLRAGDELGGHIVQGHVDGVGTVRAVSSEGDGRRVTIGVPEGLSRYIVEKGSVTVDGVSLTVTAVEGDGFEVTLVSHTLEVTTLGDLVADREVNIEVDVLAKYVERLMTPWTAGLRAGTGHL